MHSQALREQYDAIRPELEFVATSLQSEVVEVLREVPRIDRVSFRVKAIESLERKVCKSESVPRYSSPITEIEDLVAGRVLVFFCSDIEDVQKLLKKKFAAVESSRRHPEKDAEFGYESHHLICQIPPQSLPLKWMSRMDVPKMFEIQVRTLFMHAWAEPQHDLGYKAASELPREIRRELAWVAASAWGADNAFDRVWKWQRSQDEIGSEGRAEPNQPS